MCIYILIIGKGKIRVAIKVQVATKTSQTQALPQNQICQRKMKGNMSLVWNRDVLRQLVKIIINFMVILKQ